MKKDNVDIGSFEVPYAALGGIYVELFSNRKLTAQGNYTILDYNENLLKLKFSKNELIISGKNMRLFNLKSDEITVVGLIEHLEYNDRR